MQSSKRVTNASTIVLAALLLAGCGGGGGGGGGSSSGGGSGPPPPSVPPVTTTPTVVRVSRATPFADACLSAPGATVYVNAEVEPHLAIDPTNGNHLVAAWQQDRLSDGGSRGNVTSTSTDGGATWSAPRPAAFSRCGGGDYARVSDPWLAVNGPTALQIAIAFTGAALSAGSRSAVVLSRSTDGGFSWGPTVTLVDDDGSLYFHDKETLTIDPTDARYVYATWDRLEPSGRGPAMFARSADGGVTWSRAAVIFDPGEPNHQTIGNQVVVARDGTLYDFFTELTAAASGGTTAQLAYVRSQDKGLTWSAPVRFADLRSVGTRLPSVPSSAVRAGEVLANFAADPRDGTLYAAWQDSRFSGGTIDGIAVSWSTDGGQSWSEPSRVNGNASAPAFTPTLAVLPDGAVGVQYYDFRDGGSASFQPTNAWLSVTRDRRSWRETLLAGNFDFRIAPDAGGLFVGDYQGLAGAAGTFATLYVRTNNGDASNRTDVFADRVSATVLSTAASAKATIVRPSPLPAWTADAERKVSMHLQAVREARLRRWTAKPVAPR